MPDPKPVGTLTPLSPAPVGELKPLNQAAKTDEAFLNASGTKTPEVKTPEDHAITRIWGDKPKEEPGFGHFALKALESASAYLGSGIAKTPGLIYDTFAAPFNYIASGRLKDDLLAVPQIGNSKILQEANYGDFDKNYAAKTDYFKNIIDQNTNPGSISKMILDTPEKVAQHYDKVVEENHKQQNEKYGTSAEAEFSKGNYGNGLKLLSLSAIESVPTMASLMLGNAAGVTTAQSTLIGGAVFGAQKKAELDKEFPDMPEGQKIAVSWLNGLSEGYIENSFGLTKLGSEIGNIFAKKGIDAGKKLAAEGFKDVYLPVLKKYAGNFTEEVGSEMTTQYVQNAIDKYVGGDENKNLFDGVLTAGATAGLISGPIVGLTGSAELHQLKKGIKQQEEGVKQEQITKDEQIKKDAERNKAAVDMAQKSDEAIRNFKESVYKQVQNGELTKEQGDHAVMRVNSYKEYNDIVSSLNLPEEKKLEVFDKTFQKQNLESELRDMGKPNELHPLKQAEYSIKEKLANDLQKDINEILFKAQIKNETTVGKKTIDDLVKEEAKANEKPKEGEKPKPKPTGVLKAFEDKYKENLPKEDNRTLPEVPVPEFNDNKFNARVKHDIVSRHLEQLPGQKEYGRLIERPFEWNGKGSTVLGVELPGGYKFRFGSSMERIFPENEGGKGIRGHTMQERLKRFDEEIPVGMPIGMKVYNIQNEEGETIPHIKAFRASDGKFIAWMKKTNTGSYTPDPVEKEQLEHLETVDENDNTTPEVIPPVPAPSSSPKKLGPSPTSIVPRSGNVFMRQKPITSLAPKTPVKNNLEIKKTTPNLEHGKAKNTLNRKESAAGNNNQTSEPGKTSSPTKTVTLRTGTKKSNRKIKDAELKLALRAEVFTPYDLTIQHFIRGAQINHGDLKKFFSNKSRVGYAHTEVGKRISYRKNNGQTREAMAHALWEEHSNLNYDTTDWLNAVEEVIRNFHSTKAMAQDLNSRINKVNPTEFTPAEKELGAAMDDIVNDRITIDVEDQLHEMEAMNPEEIIKLSGMDLEEYKKWLDLKDIIRDNGEAPLFEPNVNYLRDNSTFNNFTANENTQEYKTKGEGISYNSASRESSNPEIPGLFEQESQNDSNDTGITWMERQMNKGSLSLLGGTKIKSSDDVAYLFRHLERAVSENVFAVFIKDDGTYNVLYVNTGTTSASVIDTKLIYTAAKEFGASKISFVHNHPSGNLNPSEADHSVLNTLRGIMKNADIEVMPGIIINLDSGKYTEFDNGSHEAKTRPTSAKNEKKVDVYQFDKQILYTPSSEKIQIKKSEDVAKFLSIQKRGLVPKMGVIVMDRQNNINKYVMVDPNLSEKELIDTIITNVGKSGENVILTGNAPFKSEMLRSINKQLKGVNINILDAIQVEAEKSITDNYKSLSDEGVLEPEANYKKINKKDFNYFREKHLKRDTEKEDAILNAINDLLDEDVSEEKRLDLETDKATIMEGRKEDKKEYDIYKQEEKKLKQIELAQNLEGVSLDDLIEAYNTTRFYEETLDRTELNTIRQKIGYFLSQQGKERLLKHKNFIEENANKKDLDFLDTWTKVLSHMSQNFPELQELSKIFDDSFLKMQQERLEKKKQLTKLANAVISEKNKKLGIIDKAKGLIFHDTPKYFEFMDDGTGHFVSGQGLTKAQKDFLDFVKELTKDRQLVDEDGDLVQNEVIKIDPGFHEKYDGWIGKTLGFFKMPIDAYIEAKENAKSAYSSIYNGRLTNKFNKPRPKDTGYSKDFYKAAQLYIDDYTHVKHMSKMVALVDSISLLNERGFGEQLAKPNVVKWLQQWSQEQIYKAPKTISPGIDLALKLLRRLTSTIIMGFNIPAAGMNLFIGNYNNWRKDVAGLGYAGLKSGYIGNKRFFSKKGFAILKHYGVIDSDFDSNPQAFAGKLFDMLAYGAQRYGEMQIQGSMFLSQLSPEEWNSFEYKDGEAKLKDPANEQKIADSFNNYKNNVSNVQGKYSEKDRRNFMRGEMGKALSQFKTWMPDFMKERFGEEYIDRNNITHRGSFNMFTKQALSDLKADWSNEGITGVLKNKQVAQNLKGAMFIAGLLVYKYSDDDDKETKRKVLSVENAIGNLLFIFDPEQLEYTLKNPVAIQGTVLGFIAVLKDLMKLDGKKLKKDVLKITPYKKIVKPLIEGDIKDAPRKILTGQ